MWVLVCYLCLQICLLESFYEELVVGFMSGCIDFIVGVLCVFFSDIFDMWLLVVDSVVLIVWVGYLLVCCKKLFLCDFDGYFWVFLWVGMFLCDFIE